MHNVVLTDFQKRVYEQLQLVQPGQFTTYQALAKAINCPSPRAVANALRRNPFAPAIPCHRVLRSDYYIGGYKGSTDPDSSEVQEKKKRLEDEGISFDRSLYVIPEHRAARCV
jgi:methylated-DNA-[protein]-cysteine S-methyltransferase